MKESSCQHGGQNQSFINYVEDDTEYKYSWAIFLENLSDSEDKKQTR